MSATALACFHCGEPVRTALAAAEPAYCCAGCAQAAAFIRDAGLGDYYRLRSATAPRPDTSSDLSLWNRDDLIGEFSRELAGGVREITLLIEGMRCAACAWLIDSVLRRETGVVAVQVNAVTGRLRLQWSPRQRRLSELLGVIQGLGYRAYLANGVAGEDAARREQRSLLLRLGVAGLVAMQAMMFSEALYLDTAREMPVSTRDFFRWLSFLLSTPVVFYSGMPFLRGLFRELRRGRPGMDTLVGGSVLLAYFASLVETLRGGRDVWFDAAVMFVFLLLTARALESWARRRANASVDRLLRASPTVAERRCPDGSFELVPIAALRCDDEVRVAIGATVPADGIALSDAELDESVLTGESRPVLRRCGSEVIAGSICTAAPLALRLTRVGADTRLSYLLRQVESAQQHRPALAESADRFAARLVPSLLLVAMFALYWAWPSGPGRAFETALAVLVVACPCALSLATPVALVAAYGRLAGIGVLCLRPDALERLARVDQLAFDKTGTLTFARLVSIRVAATAGISAEAAGAIAAALERQSGHPFAAAFVDSREHVVSGLRAYPGQGVEGWIDGHHYRLGRAEFAACAADDGALWLARDGVAVATFELADCLRADAPGCAQALRELGLKLAILSGDSRPAVAAAAAALGIEPALARLSPEDKQAWLNTTRSRGAAVAMVGDGINDAPVLAAADVGIALGDGSALALRAADLVLTGNKLERIPQAIALARATRRIIRQNIAWALGYNALAIPLAASGQVPPWLAALGMALSSLLVTLNALRLLTVGRATTLTHSSESRPYPTANQHSGAPAVPGLG